MATANFLRYPGGKAKALTFSYDDRVPQDKRLAQIFDKYIPCKKSAPAFVHMGTEL